MKHEIRTYRSSSEVGGFTFRKVRNYRICSQSRIWRRRLNILKPTISLITVCNEIEARLQRGFAPILEARWQIFAVVPAVVPAMVPAMVLALVLALVPAIVPALRNSECPPLAMVTKVQL
jgi:hypothetical protein